MLPLMYCSFCSINHEVTYWSNIAKIPKDLTYKANAAAFKTKAKAGIL